MNACDNFTWSRPRVKFESAGMLSLAWLVCSRLPGSSVHWDSGSLSEVQDGSPTGSLPRTDIRSANVAVVRAK